MREIAIPSHSLNSHWRTPIRGPTVVLQPIWPRQHPHENYEYAYTSPPSTSPPHFFLIHPQTLRSASSLTCILSGLLLTCLSTTTIQNRKSITRVTALAPADFVWEVLMKNRRAPSHKNRGIWFVQPSSCGLSGCLPKSDSEILVNLMVACLDPWL